MFYYAYIDSNNIVTGVYAMPTEITINGYIPISQDQYTNGNLIGKMYDEDTDTFVTVPTWACSSDVVRYKSTQTSVSSVLDDIDEAIAVKADIDDLHSHSNKTVLDGITSEKVTAWDNSTQGNDGASAYEIAVDNGFTGTEAEWLASLQGSDGSDGSDGLDGTTVVVGTTTTGNEGTNASVSSSLNSETNTLTLNFTIPKGDTGESGTSASITAAEVLNKLKTVDGVDSELDADTLDGIEATGFATASHNHDTAYSAIGHTHSDYLTSDDVADFITADALSTYATTSAMNTALSGKSDTTHNHDSDYADISHSHTIENVTGLATALAGKSNTDHNHNTAYAPISHSHSIDNVTGLSTALSGKANSSHTHYQSDISGLETALSNKASSAHTHTLGDVSETETKKILTAAERTKLSGIDENANNYSHPTSHPANMISGLSDVATSGSYSDLSDKPTIPQEYVHPTTHPASIITGLATVATSGSYSDLSDTPTTMSPTAHTHSQSEITGLTSALNAKAQSVHTHSIDDISETATKKIFTSSEKTKLSGIETGANNYSHPASHSASMITGLSTVATSGSYDDLTDKPTSMTPTEHTHSQYVGFDDIYPVGSIYLSVNNTNPSSLFGGTWTQFSAGRVLCGVATGGSAETTGGSSTASIAAHSHTTQNHVLTISEIPQHKHDLLNYNVNGYTNDTFTNNSVEGLTKKGFCGNVMTAYSGGGNAHSHGNTGSAGATTISVVQPYITCYMWKRTN